MSNYSKTLGLLDTLIAKLEANTGGEPLLPSETLPPIKQAPTAQPVVSQSLLPAEQPPKEP